MTKTDLIAASDLPTRARNALMQSGVYDFAQLQGVDWRSVFRLPNMGRVSFTDLVNYLKHYKSDVHLDLTGYAPVGRRPNQGAAPVGVICVYVYVAPDGREFKNPADAVRHARKDRSTTRS